MDFNYFNGTFNDLLHFAGMTAPAPVEYTVKAGDMLTGIARKYNVELDELVTLNNDKLIQAGKKLIIPAKITLPPPPAPPPPPPPVSAPIRYVIQPGDTLSAIASRFGTTVPAIVALNPQITNPNLIIAGDTLLIPRV